MCFPCVYSAKENSENFIVSTYTCLDIILPVFGISWLPARIFLYVEEVHLNHRFILSLKFIIYWYSKIVPSDIFCVK
jgi:hypothetical protein